MIPQELIQYPQWVLWRSVAKPDGTYTKLPFSAITGGMASVSDKTTWTTFDIAQQAAKRLVTGLGFVLTKDDPFAFIDLDNAKGDQAIVQRQIRIEEAFQSYSEISPSKLGLHIICKGAVARGRRRDKVEVYSSERFMTVTGNTYRDLPIEDRSDLLRLLWDEIGGSAETEMEIHDESQKYDDEVIYNMAREAANGDKFLQLWQGEYLQAGYPSQSEADFALVDILGFYSRNLDQIKRMFLRSALGQRDKAKRRNYVDNMVKRSFDNQPPFIDLSELEANTKKQLEDQANGNHKNPFAGPLFENVPDPSYEFTLPPGLLGEIAQFIYDSSPRQVHEIALAASIGLMAGICGKAYNVSGTGLNQYVLLLAKTGSGKEGLSKGIDRLMAEVQRHGTPAAMDYIGPSAIASGQALMRHLSKIPCFVSIVGEFGLTLQAMCAYNANSAQITLRKTLLEIYMKSGKNEVYRGTIYSDKANNVPIIVAPAFSLLGESTQHAYYGGLDEAMIAQGLLPRFLTIEYTGRVPYLNHSHTRVTPSVELIQKLSDLAANCLTLTQNQRAIDVQIENDALEYANSFSKETTDSINQAELTVVQELWNRAHLKMLKLAALLAVGNNPFAPVIDIQMMKWSKAIVERDIKAVLKQFESGFVGGEANEAQQIDKVVRAISEYILVPSANHTAKYGIIPQMQIDRVFPFSYLQRRLLTNSAFKHDRIGALGAMKRTVETLVSDGSIREVRQIDVYSRYKTTAKSYAVIDLQRFLPALQS